MRKKKKMRRNNGITLIALVITIIVLLILAGVAISMLSGENGILRKAGDAKTRTEDASFAEKVRIATMSAMANKEGKMNKDTLKSELKKSDIEEENILNNGQGGYVVKQDNNIVNIRSSGTVMDLSGISDTDREIYDEFIKKGVNYRCTYGYITGILPNIDGEFDTVKTLEDALPEGYKVVSKFDDEAIEESQKSSIGLATGMAVTNKEGVEVARTVIFGDVNCDGEIDSSDELQIQKYCRDITPNCIRKNFQKAAANVYNDSEFNFDDWNTIINWYNYDVGDMDGIVDILPEDIKINKQRLDK